MNEVKRYDLTIEELGSSEDGYLEQFIESSDGEYVKLSDFKSERALRIDAEKKLHELQDAIALRTQRQVSMGNNSNDYQIKYSLIFPKQGLMDEILISNIQESRKRGEAK